MQPAVLHTRTVMRDPITDFTLGNVAQEIHAALQLTGADPGEAGVLYAARAALRWNESGIERDTRLHCRVVLALSRYERPYAALTTAQQRSINRDVDVVVNVFRGRMTDRSFLFLGADQRTVLEPERGTAVSR